MGRAQRAKGARGELEAAEQLRKVLGIKAERSARNGVKGAGDLVTNLDGWRIEVKRYARLTIESKFQKVELDAALDGEQALMMMRADDCEWLVVMRLDTLPDLVMDWKEALSEPDAS
jgi:anionic cell wall polymer biosynthesis LytR-Cps2A-Psr (LCP) family protein